MLIVFAAIGVLVLAIGLFLYFNHYDDTIYFISNTCGIFILSASVIAIIVVGLYYSNNMIIDDKINLYRTENSKIEQQISVVVSDYMGYESDTLKDLKSESPIALVSLYPELKSNELVAKQIDVYVKNNAAIKELELERLGYRVLAWWLFFGG